MKREGHLLAQRITAIIFFIVTALIFSSVFLFTRPEIPLSSPLTGHVAAAGESISAFWNNNLVHNRTQAVDRDLSTFYMACPQGSSQPGYQNGWLVYDLGQARNLTNIVIDFVYPYESFSGESSYPAGQPCNYTLTVSLIGTSWRQVYSRH